MSLAKLILKMSLHGNELAILYHQPRKSKTTSNDLMIAKAKGCLLQKGATIMQIISYLSSRLAYIPATVGILSGQEVCDGKVWLIDN